MYLRLIPKHIPGVDMRLDLSRSRENGINGGNRMFTVIKKHAWKFDFDDITYLVILDFCILENFL